MTAIGKILIQVGVGALVLALEMFMSWWTLIPFIIVWVLLWTGYEYIVIQETLDKT